MLETFMLLIQFLYKIEEIRKHFGVSSTIEPNNLLIHVESTLLKMVSSKLKEFSHS